MTKTNVETKLPGLIDLQVNGHGGIDFNDPSLHVEDVQRVCQLLKAEDVVGFLPTLITNDYDSIESRATTILSADPMAGAEILGLHLEGPFISPQDGARGAHNAQWVHKPDFDWIRRLHDLTDGRSRILTCSPEWQDSARFIEEVCRLGIRVAIGHTLASHEQILEAVDAGASLSTHLGNGLPAMLSRHPNPLWSQLSEDRLWASLIGDGFHLPAEVFRTILKVKGDRAFLVSDSTQFAGMKPGRYQTLIGGDVVLSDSSRLYMCENERLLAGSAMSLRQIIDKMASTGLMNFLDAWELGSVRPWKYLGLHGSPPEISVVRAEMFTCPYGQRKPNPPCFSLKFR